MCWWVGCWGREYEKVVGGKEGVLFLLGYIEISVGGVLVFVFLVLEVFWDVLV